MFVFKYWYYFRAWFTYYGTYETGFSKPGCSDLSLYTDENKEKYKVNKSKNIKLIKAISEADAKKKI